MRFTLAIIRIIMIMIMSSPPVSAASPDGTWSSNFGDVDLRLTNDTVIGAYNEGSDHVGLIYAGLWTRNVLIVRWFEDWNNAHGIAMFALSNNGQLLNGKYKQAFPSPATGDWNLRFSSAEHQKWANELIGAPISKVEQGH